MLLDEPLGALDKGLRQQMQVELRQIQREVGITTVFVTHDQEEALTLSDRIAIFCEGRIVQVGTPELVYEHPRTAFAAEFLGATNFLQGRVASSSGNCGRVVLGDGTEILTHDPLPSRGATTQLTVRPEKLTIHLQEDPPERGIVFRNLLRGHLIQPVYMGSSITYRIDVGGREFVVFQQNIETQPVSTGSAIWLSWSPKHTIVLDSY